MINNKIQGRCETCSRPAELHVVADGFDDAPATFTVKRMCGGGCKDNYTQMSAKDMSYVFKLPLSGWSHTKY